MNRYPLWRYILLALLIILGLVFAAPNLFKSDPALQISHKDVEQSITTAEKQQAMKALSQQSIACLLYTSPSPRD